MAMVAIAPGMSLAHKVVPSNGSTAISTRGPCPFPTFSPMNSIGAPSRSPSPIPIVPAIARLFISRRMASAAWSAAFSLPRPRNFAAATAARSVTRAISSDRIRSSGRVVLLWLADMCNSSISPEQSILLDSDDLRLPGNDALILDGVQSTTHRILGCGVGDQNDRRRRRRTFRVIAAMGPAAWVSLHDRFKRDVLVRQMPRNGREGTGPIERKQANIVAAFVALHRRLAALGEAGYRAPKRRRAHPARDVAQIGHDR